LEPFTAERDPSRDIYGYGSDAKVAMMKERVVSEEFKECSLVVRERGEIRLTRTTILWLTFLVLGNNGEVEASRRIERRKSWIWAGL